MVYSYNRILYNNENEWTTTHVSMDKFHKNKCWAREDTHTENDSSHIKLYNRHIEIIFFRYTYIEGTIIKKIRTLLLRMSEEWLPLRKRTGLWPERGTHRAFGNLAMSCSYGLHGYYTYVHFIITYSNV